MKNLGLKRLNSKPLKISGLLLIFAAQWINLAIAEAASAADRLKQSQPAGICPSQLEGRIQAIASRPEFQRARWGILIQTLETGETLYAQEARQYFTPGSNVKLFTTAAALEQLGPDFRIRTSIYRSQSQSRGVELRVVGRGDPTVTESNLQILGQQLSQQGITRIDRLIGDDSYFQGDPVNLNWEWEDIQAGYGAPVNSLILNENAIALTLFPQAVGQPLRVVWDKPREASHWQIDNRSTTVANTEPEFVQVGRDLSQPILHIQGQLRVDGTSETAAIAIPNPSQYFIQRFRQILAAETIAVTESHVSSSPAIGEETEIISRFSPPLQTLLIETNQNSNNLYAESLLRQLGAAPSSRSAASTLDHSIAAVEATLARLGIDPEGYSLADGSGLSRHNLASPEAFVAVLRAMGRSPHAAVFRNSLAVAGVSGTLRNRFRDTPVEGRLQGKTGAMSSVAALSGYLDLPNYPSLTFSILVNQFEQPVRDVRPAIDEIVLLLGQLKPC